MLEKIFNFLGYIKEEELIKALKEKQSFINERDDEIESRNFLISKLRKEIENLERELSEMISQNNKLQTELTRYKNKAEYRKKAIQGYEIKLQEQIALKEKLSRELTECKEQLSKALSQPFKHVHEAREHNKKHRRKKR